MQGPQSQPILNSKLSGRHQNWGGGGGGGGMRCVTYFLAKNNLAVQAANLWVGSSNGSCAVCAWLNLQAVCVL